MVKIGGIELWPTAKATVKRFMAADLQGMAAEVAYHLLFSIVPLLLFLTSLSGFIGRRIGTGNVMNDITAWLRTNSNLPESTIEVVLLPIEQILENQSGGLLSVGAVIALWSGKNAVASLMKALNGAYNVEETRPWWRKQATAIGLTIALGLALIGSSVFFVAGSAAGNQIAGWLGVTGAWITVWGWARFPLIALLLCVAVSFLFWAGPDRDAPYRFISAGSAVTVALWALVTLGLGLYFQYMGGYVAAYGILGGLLGFVFWLYVMSLILLFGGLLNEVLQRQQATGTVATGWAPATRVDHLGERPRGAVHGPPVPLTSSIHDGIRDAAGRLPSAEEAARRRQIERSGLDRQGRLLAAVRMLGASALAAVSAIILGVRNRL
jgi:membrane protein